MCPAAEETINFIHFMKPEYSNKRKKGVWNSRKYKEREEDQKGYDKNIKLPNRISNSSDFSMQCCDSL
jgi:hypothetical protein